MQPMPSPMGDRFMDSVFAPVSSDAWSRAKRLECGVSHRFPADRNQTDRDSFEVPAKIPLRGASIYIVDDEEGLAELYTLFLAGTGYHVRAFTHRSQALIALKTHETKPDLLILDYMGHPPPVEQFMAQCRSLQPTLRFLMASGLNEFEVQFYAAKPDHFLQKPFTAQEFLRAVKDVLDA